ncbi:MAG: hypothetical protein RR593_04855 [Hungatella sp.]
MEKSRNVYSKKTKVIRLLITIFLTAFAALTLYPLIYIVLGSFKENAELLRGGTKLLPEKFILDNYKEAWQKANFSRYTLNSMIISFGVMAITLISTSMAGYVFARKNFRGKELLYSLFVMFMFVNVGSVTLRPLFELAVKVKMNTSLISVNLISTGTGQAT